MRTRAQLQLGVSFFLGPGGEGWQWVGNCDMLQTALTSLNIAQPIHKKIWGLLQKRKTKAVSTSELHVVSAPWAGEKHTVRHLCVYVCVRARSCVSMYVGE
jgi:hypothetical protein